MKVMNRTNEIEKALNLDKGSCRHVGSFHFSAMLNGHKVLVIAEPTDDDQDCVDIYSIEL